MNTIFDTWLIWFSIFVFSSFIFWKTFSFSFSFPDIDPVTRQVSLSRDFEVDPRTNLYSHQYDWSLSSGSLDASYLQSTKYIIFHIHVINILVYCIIIILLYTNWEIHKHDDYYDEKPSGCCRAIIVVEWKNWGWMNHGRRWDGWR